MSGFSWKQSAENPPSWRPELAVGDVSRSQAGRAIVTALALTAAYAAGNWLTKETPTFYLRQPWQDDPYDVLVSLDFVILPLLVISGGLRVLLCRRYSALPVRRLIDLLRIGRVSLAICLVTEIGQWISVALGRHRAMWDSTTGWQVAGLVAFTIGTISSLIQIQSATKAVALSGAPGAQPDWLADAVSFGIRTSRVLGRRRDRAVSTMRWIDIHLIGRVRRRPVATAAILSVLLSLPIVAVKIISEGYPPAYVVVSFVFPAASLFALIALIGRYLRIIAPRAEGTPRWISVTIVACIGGALVFAFHNALLSQQTGFGLNALFFGGSMAAGLLALCIQLAFRAFHRR